MVSALSRVAETTETDQLCGSQNVSCVEVVLEAPIEVQDNHCVQRTNDSYVINGTNGGPVPVAI